MTGWMTEHGIIKQGCTIVEVFRACCHQYGVYHSREGARFLPNILACILQCILTCFNDTSTIISYRQRCIQIGDVFYQVSSAVFCSDSCNDNAVYVARVSILTILVCIIRFTLLYILRSDISAGSIVHLMNTHSASRNALLRDSHDLYTWQPRSAPITRIGPSWWRGWMGAPTRSLALAFRRSASVSGAADTGRWT